MRELGLMNEIELQPMLLALAAREGPVREWRTERLKSNVHRLSYETAAGARSCIVKRLGPDTAHRNRMVLQRLLPALSLQRLGPLLLATASDAAGERVWHAYEDLGASQLDPAAPDPVRVGAAVDAITALHTGFAEHALLGECRLWGGDLGAPFFAANVRDAIRAVRALRAPGGERAELRDRLLARLERLRGEVAERSAQLEAFGETLLHGDLWPQNFVHDGDRVRLIDWDHAGVGPLVYDLSTFLQRFPADARHWILALYRERIGQHGVRLPSDAELNLACDTAERARISNRVIWPALAADGERADACFLQLAEIEGWFADLTPVLPPHGAVPTPAQRH
ncbi:MAG TPA: phosphotransferase [Planctomycetota bacterium]